MSFRYTFSSNHNIHKSLCGLCFWAPDPLIYQNLSNKGHMNVILRKEVYLTLHIDHDSQRS